MLTISQYESCNNQTNDALDAYQRAADLDPSNVHIKARLALLRGQPTTGLPNQGSAPMPQDVHPQTYQPTAMNGPPGPQWGAPAPSQPAQGPPPPLGSGDWSRRLADIQNPQMPPQNIQGYDHRDGLRPGGPPRQPSPRSEQMRQYGEPHRPNPPPHRGLSPSPRVHNAAPPAYGVPPSQAPPAQYPPPQEARRVDNPNYSGAAGRVPPSPANGMNGPPQGQGPMPPYGARSPPPDVRPLVENRPSPPGSGYSRPSYHHPSNPAGPGGIAGGAPVPPSAAAAAAEAAAAREKEERPPTAPPKRHREWEDDSPYKKPTTEENRGPPSNPDMHHSYSRRNSPGDRKPASPGRSPGELRRQEDQRRANEHYHPSEAAHHPPSLPSMHPGPGQQMQQSPHMGAPMSGPPSATSGGPPLPGSNVGVPSQVQTPTKEERDRDLMGRERDGPVPGSRRDLHEPAARKMEVDEDYDDDGEDEKKGGAGAASGRNTPKGAGMGATNGTVPGAANGLGMAGERAKVESAA